jgi:methyl-accepting chemotaxis protein
MKQWQSDNIILTVMRNWTIKKRIVAAFATVLVLVAALAATSFVLLRQAKTEADFMTTDALPGSVAMTAINGSVEQIQIAVLRVLMSKTAEDRKKWEKETVTKSDELQRSLDDYNKTIHLAEDRDMFNQLVAARDQCAAVRVKMTELCDAGKADEAMDYATSTIRPAHLALSAASAKMVKWNMENAINSSVRSEKAVTRADFFTTNLAILVLVLGVVSALVTVIGLNRILRRVAVSLDEGAMQVASAAGQVSSASQTLAQGASEQAASIEETSASLEELSSMTRRNTENAQQANDLARGARTAADQGSADMQKMNHAMEAIRGSSDDIAKIIKTIDEIAFQTNILALNAAVEAARAGDAGMGFAVVADEVRNLAQRSAQAAKETAAKIENAIGNSNQGVEISSLVTKALENIVVKVRQLDELAAGVANASREQTQGITQINGAVGQVEKVVQCNASNAEESAAAAEELNAQAATMKQSVGELLNLVGGQSRMGSTPGTRRKSPPVSPPAATKTLPGKWVSSAPAIDMPPPAKNGDRKIPIEDGFQNF